MKIIGVRFRTAGKVYYFDPDGNDVKANGHVIVETARGVEYGTVAFAPKEMDTGKFPMSIKKIIRVATEEDANTYAANKAKEKSAYDICLQKIHDHNLAMKLIACEYTFDNNKVLFYFTADGRVDFRELVKDLASVFRTRIELRQIGVRDETKMVGGIGICGRPLCCASYMPEFIPVSIKMAKEQGLSLNPGKISGACGRLMCCLKYEEAAYEDLNSKLPNIGDTVETPEGLSAEVTNIAVLKQKIKVLVTLDSGDKEAREYSVSDLKFKPRKHHVEASEDSREAEKLEAMDKREKGSDLDA
ncbi:MAG: stage 0 sporulation family protein [Catonella sp.]|jgi:cell fate regulator YaaT (PSP1 superfamily)|nr:stage 0 sporulation family protein [Catonella sp.]MDY6357808.1 stage 0 sporulation family protein [Catonella sp.]